MSVSSETAPVRRERIPRTAAHWSRSYLLLTRWTLLRLRALLPVMLVIQIVLSVGIVVGFAFLIPGIDTDPASALYLATGAPTLAMVTIGMAMAPGMVSQQKMQGLFDYQRSLPVPRTAMLAADATVWVAAALPGVAAGLWVATLRFDLTLTVTPLVVPALLLVALTCMAVGYAIAYLVPPMAAQMIANLVMFFALMFSPINFPAERLPAWLADVHTVLPFAYMAQAIRETLSVPPEGVSVLPFAVLAAWCAAGLVLTHRVMSRRG